MTLWQAYNAYDPNTGISFDGFLRSCLQKKFKTELTHRHRQKRVLNQLAVSLDTAGDGEDECSLLKFVSSDFDTFEEVVKRNESQAVSDKVQSYISRLKTGFRTGSYFSSMTKTTVIRSMLTQHTMACVIHWKISLEATFL